jgi:hypothetical protein
MNSLFFPEHQSPQESYPFDKQDFMHEECVFKKCCKKYKKKGRYCKKCPKS